MTIKVEQFHGLRTDTDQLSLEPGESPSVQNVAFNKIGSLKRRAGLTKVWHDDPSVHVLSTDTGKVQVAWGKGQADSKIQTMKLFMRTRVPTRPPAPTNTLPIPGSTVNTNPTLQVTYGLPTGTLVQWTVGTGINGGAGGGATGNNTLTGVVWQTGWLSIGVYGNSIVVNATNGTFQGTLAGATKLNNEQQYVWTAQVKDDDDGESDPSDPTDTTTEEEPVVVPCTSCDNPPDPVVVTVPDGLPNPGTYTCMRSDDGSSECEWRDDGTPTVVVTPSAFMAEPDNEDILWNVTVDGAGYLAYSDDCNTASYSGDVTVTV